MSRIWLSEGSLWMPKRLWALLTPRACLHRLLVGQKGGRLGEEDREGAQAEILHRVGAVLARAPVVQAGQRAPQGADQGL